MSSSQWTQQQLVAHLQDAVELELYTIPLYLCAMYSITPAAQDESGNNAFSLIQSVVNEEMLHLELACNTLNALGGHPVLTGGAAPSYPSNIPFIYPPMEMQLSPVSLRQILDFMQIELPSYDDPEAEAGPEPDYDTIGAFYDAVENGLAEVNSFPGNPDLQVSGVFNDDLAVSDLATADQALNLIVSQGEGTSITNPDDSEGVLAHYYRFAEIASNPQWIIGDITEGSGPPEPRVYDMIINPNALTYSAQQEHLLGFFDGCFSFLLEWLQADFNGNPANVNANNGPISFGMFKVIQPLMQYVISQTYDQAGTPEYGQNLTPRFNYVTAGYPKTSILQGLYEALSSADQQSLSSVAQTLGIPNVVQ
ncbi:MAG TPA: ferritin-like protein [Blastocatellia bacterium]|nr:ferritin-like protein [Blastocatellia bacterium]